MGRGIFRFKQFAINQDKCAMKVGTDSVLLGSWCKVNNKHKILDIGSGTGILSLMLAQRASDSIIDAIEIDNNAYLQSVENINNSPWKNRINIFNNSFQAFAEKSSCKYDLIISNPPYFENSLKSDCHKRTTARHTDSLSYEDLLSNAVDLLAENGIIALVYPIESHEKIKTIAKSLSLKFNDILFVKGNHSGKVKRVLAELTNQIDNTLSSDDFNNNILVIESQRHIYTQEYIGLTKDFYLKM